MDQNLHNNYDAMDSDQDAPSAFASAPAITNTTAGPSSTSPDIEMAYDETPARPSISDSVSESDFEDALEVEMQAVAAAEHDDPPLVQLGPPPVRRNNRRARVEDDDDDERDRRHPSHRVVNDDSSNRPHVYHSSMPQSPRPESSAPQTPPPPPLNQPRFFPGGFAISFGFDGQQLPRMNPMPTGTGGEPQSFADLFSNPMMLNELFGIEPDVDDPERAEKLIAGLEEVPVGLVRRLERVGGTGDELSGGDSGCAICWDKLLQAETTEEIPKIVTLPCAHVFHAECLRPWFSRPKRTTCPTCRFNIDPENLTFIPYRHRQRREAQQENGTNETTSASTSNTDPTAADSTTPLPTADADPTPATPQPERPTPTPEEREERRAGSEPPGNRPPRPSAADLLSSILPGGHVVSIVFGDIGPGGPGPRTAAMSNNSESTANPSSSRTATGSGTPPMPQRPLSETPSPTTPEGTPPLPFGGPGINVVSFDLHVPLPIFLNAARRAQPPTTGATGSPNPQPSSSQSSPQPPPSQQSSPLPQSLRDSIPMPPSFAGLNFGQREPVARNVSIGDILRRVYQARDNNAGPSTAEASAGTSGGPSGATPAASGSSSSPSPSASNPSPFSPFRIPSLFQSPRSERSQRSPSPGNESEEEGQPPRDDGRPRLPGGIGDPSVLLQFLVAAFASIAATRSRRGGGGGAQSSNGGPPPPPKDWMPPPAPGPTLRQRIERREREAGLRCCDVSCGVGPSDDDPFVALTDAATKQLSIRVKGSEGTTCGHTFHSSCLVSAERVALSLKGVDMPVSVEGTGAGDESDVEVSCPVCRGVGCVSRVEWEDGVTNLQ